MHEYLLLVQVSEWALFFGRFHPILVHLPIGFLLLTGFLECLRFFKKIDYSVQITSHLLAFSAISAIISCGAGYLLSLGGGYDEQILTEHQWQGIWVAVCSTFAWVLANTTFSALYRPVLLVAIFLTMLAGHHGGALTHGSGYLTQYFPEPIRTWAGLPPKIQESEKETPKIADINQALVFQDIIHPILQNRCESCHNAQKSKGGLRLDSIDLLKKGGEHGTIVEAGNIEKSPLIQRILLDLENDEHMPPKGKTQLTSEQIDLVKWWIETGANFDKKVTDLPIKESIKPILQSMGTGTLKVTQNDTAAQVAIPQLRFLVEDKLLSTNTTLADENVINTFIKKGCLLLPVAKNTNFLELNAVNYAQFSDQDAQLLPSLAPQLIWLKLNGTAITDKTLAEVGKLKNLTRLHLQNTAITDAGLRPLCQLPNLEYLNLVGTKVSDAGLRQLAALKNLKVLYIWQTQASPNFNLPHIKIERGIK